MQPTCTRCSGAACIRARVGYEVNVADTMFWNRISEFFSPTMGRFRDGLKSIIPRIKGPFIPKKAIHKEKLNRTQKKNKQEYLKHFQAQTSALNIVKTTQHSDGQLIDWIPIESQGEIAEAPPIPERVNLDSPERHGLRPKAELEFDGAEVGPEGTVPVPRQNIELLDFNKTLHERLSKQAPPIDGSNGISTSAANHWYASSAQSVSNNGGSGIFSMFKPYMGSSSDFSLIQSAVIRSNVPMPYNQSVTGPQTVEAGWINWPVQGAQPHLFTFFTTNGYKSFGNNVSGWNRDVQGWVQTDSQIFPGTAFSPLSQDGGAQYELKIQWLLYQGNWWLFVVDRWIGYYPAQLFANNISDRSRTLADSASQINFYGEIYQAGDPITNTDMGSGQFPETQWPHSAYIHNITYTDRSGNAQLYDGGSGMVTSDSNRYRIQIHFKSGSNWGSYCWLGGPGAGGKVGG